MKIKESAQHCGLTEKAIRLYESKGLVSPVTAEKNGRIYRDYDEKCIRDLMTVGILRRVGFSMEQIGAMQKDSSQISDILEEYGEKLASDIENMTAAREAMAVYDCADSGIDVLADALLAALGGGEEKSVQREQTIRWRVWDEDITAEQKQTAYLQFTQKQSKRERAEEILLTVPRRVGGFFGRIWSELRCGVVNERGRVRGGVLSAVIFLLMAMILGGNLAAANKRMDEMQQECVNAVFSSVR